MGKRLVSILVPALNEAPSIKELFERVDRVMEGLGERYEFILVDDGSTDDTKDVMALLRKAHPQVGLVRHHRNHGKSMALMQGFAVASGDVIVTMDADLQDQPEDIHKFLAAIDEGYDLVGGWRQNRKDGFFRRFVSGIFNRLTRTMVHGDFRDINCGFKAMTAEVAHRLDLRGDMHRIIPLVAQGMGYRCTEVPVDHKPRVHGRSRYRLLRHRGLLDLVSYAVFNTTQIRPFHVFCEFGALFFAIGLLSIGGWLIMRLFTLGPVGMTISAILLGFGCWAGLVGTFCPFFGLFLESSLRYRQDEAWRKALVREYLPSRPDES